MTEKHSEKLVAAAAAIEESTESIELIGSRNLEFSFWRISKSS